jgi:hypothetical protein
MRCAVGGRHQTCAVSSDLPTAYGAAHPPPPLRWSGDYYSLTARRVAILDTNYILNKVKERVRLGTAGWLVRLPGLKTHCFASRHVLDELYRADQHGHRHKWDKLAEQSVKEGWTTPADTFRQAFEEEYLGQIRFVEVGGMFEDEPHPVAVRTRGHGQGIPDSPTAQLAVLLSRTRPIVYAHDDDLYKPGVAPRPKTLAAVEAAHRDIEKGQATVGAGNATIYSAGYSRSR